MDNPFKYGCVVSGDHFCERRKAERELRGFIKAGQNVFVQGERRMGKTSYIEDPFYPCLFNEQQVLCQDS